MTEWYSENLTSLIAVMNAIDSLASIDGVFELEVRVRVDDMDTWAVIGYGESGDPCVLRFEETSKPEPVNPFKPQVYTINKDYMDDNIQPLFKSSPPYQGIIWNDGHSSKM